LCLAIGELCDLEVGERFRPLGAASAGSSTANSDSSSASPNTAGGAIIKGSKPTLRQMSWMNRNWSLLASASKAFRATSILLPVSPACGSAGGVAS
jgi:hypothetical protein